MATQTPRPGQLARSQALDDLIMGTNSSSIVSKRSVERLYYPDEPHFFRYFVKKFQRRAPLINRGYWLRLRAIDVVVRQFLTRCSASKKVVINLGCGSDILPWQSHARHGSACDEVLFVDIDYPDLMIKKRAVVLETPQLRELLGADFKVSESHEDQVLLKSERYCQIGCDLRQLDKLRAMLETFLSLAKCEVLFVAEVSVTYMDTHSADSLIQWASSIGKSEFCLLEQILPCGPDHPFAKTMLSHFDKLKTPPKSVGQYPTLESQRDRFQGRGWRRVDIWDLWEAWSSDYFLSSAERSALDQVEPFDEWEEFMLFARHYFIIRASATPIDGEQPSQPLASKPKPDYPGADVEVTSYQGNAPRRRFGDALVMSNSMGRQFALHMMGSGTNSRTDTYDVYSLGRHNDSPKLPLAGPLPRMCYTVTDLGDFGVLLVGGRGSPASAFSDCWLFHRGAECRWQSTWRLPVPLFRHSSIRLKGSSLALVMGGKTGPSKISEDSYVFDPERGWLRCQIRGCRPRPAFGAIVCSSTQPSKKEGVFHGLIAGGIGQDGRVLTEKYSWRLDTNESQPAIEFEMVTPSPKNGDDLSLFGAKCAELGSCTVVCGGMGQDASFQGCCAVAVTVRDGGSYTTLQLHSKADGARMPFMIGSSIIPSDRGVAVVGGGATCFSMGTFWETGVYSITIPDELWQHKTASNSPTSGIEYMESHKVVGSTNGDNRLSETPAGKATMTAIPRIKVSSEKAFDEALRDGRPHIIEGLDLGNCLQRWTSEYMVERVGEHTKVIVHECHKDTDKMDFNSKNFRYVTDSFGNIITKIQAGGRMYLRSLSREKPSEQPANIEMDFPRLAEDFCLPQELTYIRENLFSSVLRVSGRVNMWLHYDVMANVYAQIVGHKRMILFPPSDVTHLSFAPGASSSSLDVFSELDSPSLAVTRPHEAVLKPGDVLLLPALWLHTAAPTSDMSVAVNIFFRDLERGYAAGRDVYGNRDLAAYEKGRLDAARIAKGFQQLPVETRRFYLARIADELQQAAEGV